MLELESNAEMEYAAAFFRRAMRYGWPHRFPPIPIDRMIIITGSFCLVASFKPSLIVGS